MLKALTALCVLAVSATADNQVHIRYKNSHQMTPLMTSSTLNWLSHTHYLNSRSSREIVIGSFERQEPSGKKLD